MAPTSGANSEIGAMAMVNAFDFVSLYVNEMYIR